MLENNDRFPLRNIILEDLFTSNKLVLILLLAITLSALGTVWLTHQTRGLVAEKGDLILQYQALENEYLNLRLEEATLSDNTRIEAIAKQFGMQRATPEQEVVILEYTRKSQIWLNLINQLSRYKRKRITLNHRHKILLR